MDQPGYAEESNSFGDWLQRRRKALDLTQAQMAQHVGCTAATIRKIEADERKPSLQLAEQLATALHVPEAERAAFLQAARQVEAVTPLPWGAQTPLVVSTSPKFLRNFPAPMTSLVDRVRDIGLVVGLLSSAQVRLLTLLGPPGIGKTRLALRAAETMTSFFGDGVCFVDLSPITDATLVLPAIAYALSVSETGVTPLAERLRGTLAEKELLLVLDNFEQVSSAATDVAELLRGCEKLKVLATSRTPLLLAGEHEYRVPPLSHPPSGIASEMMPEMIPETLLAYEAVQLFVARVRQHQHDFAITAANADSIATLCLRLDGMPLALELAAAALRRMTMARLVLLLQEEAKWLHELYSPARDLPPRQRTLYQAIAWSYSLLNASEQSLFRHLGIFIGGFATEAAEAICGADEAALMLLTEQSLLARASERWQMLEMIREFALAQMSSSERSAAQQRHSAYYVAQITMHGDASAQEDYANLRAALWWAISTHDVQTALTLFIALCDFWEMHGYLGEGFTLARAVIAMPDAAPARLRLDALESISSMAWQSHHLDEALVFAEQAMALARSNGRPEEVALSLNLLGRIFIEQSNYTHAEAVLQECIHFASQVPHLFNPGCPQAQLGEVALARREWAAAKTYLLQAVTSLASEQGPFIGIFTAMTHTALAELALAGSDPVRAHHELQEACPLASLSTRRLRCVLVTLAGLLLTRKDPLPMSDAQAATRFLGAEARLGELSDTPSLLRYQTLIAQRSAASQRCLTQQSWQAAWDTGHSWTQAQAGAEAEKWLEMAGRGF